MANQTAVTPFRATHVRLDVSEWTLREPPFSNYRTASQMARANSFSRNMHYLESGAWALEPLQQDLSNLHERTDSTSSILPLSAFSAVTGMVERPIWRQPTDLMGVTVDTGVAASGDKFIVKTVAAGVTWAQTKAADIAAFGQVVYKSKNVTVDRVAIGTTSHPENQPIVLRVVIPSFAPHSHDVVGSFYFGGPVDILGNGIYSVELLGNGEIHLWARQNDPDHPGQFTFGLADYWDAFGRASATQVVVIRIWPHYDPTGAPIIEFRTETTSASSGRGSVFQSLVSPGGNPKAHVWRGIRRLNTPDVTGPGPVRVDIRRDLRVPFQVSLLRYLATGLLVDDPFAMPFFPQSTVAPITLIWQSVVPAGCGLVGKLYDVATDLELTLISSGSNYAVYSLNPGSYHYYAAFEFASDAGQTKTPTLWNYKVIRDGQLLFEARDEVDASAVAIVRQVSITGPERDYTHETASVQIEDPQGHLAQVNTRARIRTVIETEYDPLDSTKRSVLFEGFLDRGDGLKKGTNAYEGFTQQGAVRAYPSANWKAFNCTFSSMSRKLREKLTFSRFVLGGDQTSPDPKISGPYMPYKVTDICRALLEYAGIPPSQVDVPDSPIRFYPSGDGSGEDSIIDPLSEIGEAVVHFLHDYLGWFLIWDGNAQSSMSAPRGMIRARPPSIAPYVNLARFTMDLPSGGPKFVTRPETYGSVNFVGPIAADDGPVTTWIRKRTFRTFVKPPEGSAVCVTGTGDVLPNRAGQYQNTNWAWNPKAYDYWQDGGAGATSDQTHPDYVGEFIPIVVVNTSLPLDVNGLQTPVDIVCRRTYDVSCHAIKMAVFEAPLVLVWDWNDPYQIAPRPLRYYDPVVIRQGGVDTQWLVRNCNPTYRKDHVQMAYYELEAPRI